MKAIVGPEGFASAFNVSRETLGKLTHLVDETKRWNRTIQLIAPRSEADIWSRHIADSAQLWHLRPRGAQSWIDLGSGGGYPGLVIAVLAAAGEAPLTMILVESDKRKAAFLTAASRNLDLPVRVTSERAETLRSHGHDVLSARAFAPLPRLIGFVARLRNRNGTALLPKGRRHDIELDAALALWDFDYKLHPSLTDPSAAIVEIGAIHGRR